MKEFFGLIGTLTVCGSLTAATCTWTGGSGSWSETANWQGGVKPSAGDDVVLSPSAEATIMNDLGTISLAKITFSGSYKTTLTSTDAITLTGSDAYTGGKVVMTVSNTGGTIVDAPIVLGVSTDSKVNAVQIAGKQSLTFNKEISGAGKLCVVRSTTGDGTVIHLKSANTYTGGTEFTSVNVNAYSGSAFGAAKTKVKANASVMFRTAGDYDYSFDLGSHFSFYNGGTYNMGPITNSQSTGQIQPTAYSSETVNFVGGLAMPKNQIYPAAYSSAKFVHKAPLNVKSIWSASRLGGGTGPNYFMVEGNSYGSTLPLGYTFNVICGAANVLSPKSYVTKGDYVTSGVGYLYLNGHDQTVLGLAGVSGSGFWMNSTSAATLSLSGATQNFLSNIEIDGGITLVWNPAGSYTQTLTNRTHTMTGSLIVSNGTLAVIGAASFKKVPSVFVAKNAAFTCSSTTASAFAGLKTIEVEDGATATFAGNTELFTMDALTVTLGETATLTLPSDGEYYLAALYVYQDGEKVRDMGGDAVGKYPQLKGAKHIYVKDAEAETDAVTWSAGGGENRSVATWSNWDGNWHDLTLGSLLPTFAAAGATADVDRVVYCKGIKFENAVDTFTLAGSGSLKLRNLGITVAAPSSAATRTATIAVPITLKNNQQWTVEKGATLTIAAPIQSDTEYSVTNSGPGTLSLKSTSTFPGIFYHKTGALSLEEGVTDPFGEPSDTTPAIIDERTGYASSFNVYFRGVTVNRPIRYIPNNQFGVTRFYGTNVFNKSFDAIQNGLPFRPYFGDPVKKTLAKVIFNDGFYPRNYYQPDNSFWPGDIPDGCHWIVINNKPVKAERVIQLNSYQGIELNTTGNTIIDPISWWGNTFTLGGQASRVRFGVDWALNQTNMTFEVGKYNTKAKVELQGHSQLVGSLTFDSTDSTGEVSSPTPAQMGFCQTRFNVTNQFSFTGAAGLRLQGDKTMTIARAMASTAVLTVEGGTLVFAGKGSWANCTNLTVSGTGHCTIQDIESFGRRADVTLADKGVLEIPEGLSKSCNRLKINTSQAPAGVYGGEDAPEGTDKTYAAYFAGKGTLRVTTGRGLFVIVR